MFSAEVVATSRQVHSVVTMPVPIVQISSWLGEYTLSVGVVETGRPWLPEECQRDEIARQSAPRISRRELNETYSIHTPTLQSGGRLSVPEHLSDRLPPGPWDAVDHSGGLLLTPLAPREATRSPARIDQRGRLVLGKGVRDLVGLEVGSSVLMLAHRQASSLVVLRPDGAVLAWVRDAFPGGEHHDGL